MLELERVDAGYRQMPVLRNVTLAIAAGEAVAVLGPNGAGKTTLLRAIAGACRIFSGRILYSKEPLDDKPEHARAGLGIAHVPEGRKVWPSLTVEENLMIGAWRLSRAERARDLTALMDYTLNLFPRLRERFRARAGVLSGGEQQMLSIGRALMVKPSLILVDEPSLGLAPIMIDTVMHALRRLRKDRKISIMLVEQRIQEALDLCDRICILNRGRLHETGRSPGSLTREEIEASYFEDR